MFIWFRVKYNINQPLNVFFSPFKIRPGISRMQETLVLYATSSGVNCLQQEPNGGHPDTTRNVWGKGKILVFPSKSGNNHYLLSTRKSLY